MSWRAELSQSLSPPPPVHVLRPICLKLNFVDNAEEME